jgi:hypothetical protein
MWDWMAQKTGGSVRSLDINVDHVNSASNMCPNSQIIIGDSIESMVKLDLSYVNLLFLDSYDHNPPFYGLSELHAIGELAASYEKLPSGCLIAVDDCKSEIGGKHNFINVFFKRIKTPPLKATYVHVWQKP